MINFRNRDEAVPSALIVLAILVMLGGLLFMIFSRPPDKLEASRGKVRNERMINDQIAEAKRTAQEAKLAASPRLWRGDIDTVTAQVLAQVSQLARSRSLQVSAFRPQKQQPIEGIVELPFTLQISGPYPSVRAFVNALDETGSRLALRSIQIAATDGGSNAATASVGISAFYVAPDAPPKTDTSPTPAARPSAASSAAPRRAPAATGGAHG